MSPVERLAVVMVVVAAALLVGWLARRGTAVRRRRWSHPGDTPRRMLFTSETCGTCGRARRLVAELQLSDLTEVVWEEQPDIFQRFGVRRVPALLWVDEGGRGWRLDGVASVRRLRRWFGDP